VSPRKRGRGFGLEGHSRLLHLRDTDRPYSHAKETKEVSNIDYFGQPIFTYSLKQGIADGFLAPYKVVRIDIDKDIDGWRPSAGQLDNTGSSLTTNLQSARHGPTLVLDERTKLVAYRVTQYLKAPNPFGKTIVFCEDIDHATRMRQASSCGTEPRS